MTIHYEEPAVSIPAGQTVSILTLRAPSGSTLETESILAIVDDPNGDGAVWRDGAKLGILVDGALAGSQQRSQIGEYGRPQRARYTARTLEVAVWNDTSYQVKAHAAVDYETKLRTIFQPSKPGGILRLFKGR